MLSLLAFLGMTALLLLEGWCVLSVFGLKKGSIKIALSLPVTAVSSTILILLLTVFGIALTPLSIIASHILFMGITLFGKTKKIFSLPVKPESTTPTSILILCSLLLLFTAAYSISHSLFLPTFHYDSAVNWNMRSKVSFLEKKLVLAESHEHILKPHYPFLYHALQITVEQGQRKWSDRAANAIHFLLSLSALLALFLMLRSLGGKTAALLAVTLIITTPLFAMHLGGGYADIPLTLFALLSLTTFFLSSKTSGQRWLLLSALFVSACVWTKAEGLPFCLLPWLLMLGAHWWEHPQERKQDAYAALLALCLSLLWPLFALARGLPLSPHGSYDLGIGLQEGTLAAALHAIFTGGSFGVILPLALFTSLFLLFRPTGNKGYRWGLLWGLPSLAAILFVYLFTSNAVFLLNGQSFDRQLLLPCALLVLTLSLSFATKR
ncbi:hypothetical protein A2454_06475 [Candidatus Peribacteria bacterium RIFOXYC2_FULL_55_14]|nr:MAG: hypothetical protein UY85_C0022G0008 [Candidatus Peribacteria bacterium GW2011_GWB1_54_5]KKW40734.1 MAG: hypothetical protein UY87_C0013G0007 [Candidatus Peribacteria bacterium GW2011_GWC2_54_8]KKW40811.1 MAG: hypothetical protein UY90_C0071G0010 [Candidatus Peregrinibacteria bacterium GW2011_GWA2_54_9]OGJ70754.1 MAG: hypothetical protein A2198_02485 [Candidatus Peribacteria bacterium RIFOXYA1_FULL_56_14]OGJ74172.1 MAG: hypothetical protein A2217_00855 [Candidatus Peribacteria bacterium